MNNSDESNPPANLHEVDWNTLPRPRDDGGADHLKGMTLPSITLPASDGSSVTLATLPGRTIVFAYPMTGRPDIALPDNWDMIPGARGCTPQACAFRDLAAELTQVGANRVYGLSTQTTQYQQEAAGRLHLPFALLSDADKHLTSALTLPTMEVEGKTLLKRLTMVIEAGQIVETFYPVFPPDQSAKTVIDWLNTTNKSS